MQYQYCENQNFEDFASGRVIVHRSGYTNFPVRLAQEIFGRCFYHLGSPDKICLYDPCCGGGYLLTVLGFLNYETIKMMMASDVSDEALQLANENLSLLHKKALEQRIRQLKHLQLLHNKTSHTEALISAENLLNIVKNAANEIEYQVFHTDILSEHPLDQHPFKADLIITDVPYGNLVKWQNPNGEPVNLLDQLLPAVKDGSVVAICSDKTQKYQSEHFRRVEKQVIGRRLFQIFRLA